MSEALRDFLSPSQLAKHYEVIHFLAQHPNESFSLSQLDDRLPVGASVLRFPPEWIEFMSSGECGNKNIELSYQPVHGRREPTAKRRRREVHQSNQEDEEEEDEEEEDEEEEDEEEEEEEVVLICRRPLIRSVEELSELLDPPSMQPDREACIGVHTDQIILPPALLAKAQECGVAFYVPDKLEQIEGMSLTSSATGRAGRRTPPITGRPFAMTTGTSHNNTGSSPAPSTLMEEVEGILGGGGGGGGASGSSGASAAADVYSGGVPMHFLPLPPGIVLHSRHFTKRGVVIQDSHGIPSRWEVGERLLLTLDNRALVERRLLLGHPSRAAPVAPAEVRVTPAPSLEVSVDWGGLSGGGGGSSAFTAVSSTKIDTTPPARIRKKVSTVPFTVETPKTGSDTTTTTTTTTSAAFTRVLLHIEPLRHGRHKLILSVGEGDTGQGIIDIDIVAPETSQPGVLFALERRPVLWDPTVTHDSAALLFQDALLQSGSASAPSSLSSSPPAMVDVRPWWQSPSPLVPLVRDASYPNTKRLLDRAMGAVFSSASIELEARTRLARQRQRAAALRERERMEQQGLLRPDSGRRRRGQRPEGGGGAYQPDLCNTHMLFYGIDMSVPYSPPSTATTDRKT